ncbi:MAG: 3-deoxy-D-manno-octulosonic acid transferase [Boseongicola sp. SB0662_bin_57]|nr:3-deoxy-D-manno-octulosonic acid transferase [Boseongicola sp. SB0662_bin_57]
MNALSLSEPARLRYRIFLFLYACIFRVLTPLIWRYFRKRARGDAGYGLHLEERKGEGAPFAADLWLHAVSLGEINSAVPLVRLALQDGHRVLTTHATPAARNSVERTFADEIVSGQLAARFLPIDRPDYWQRFFASHAPRVGLVVEMEFWPWMIEAAREAGVPLALVNAQIPAGSWPKARRLASLIGHPAARMASVFAKSETQARRFRALGASDVRIAGETRFDIVPPETQIQAGEAFRASLQGKTVIAIASVVEGEENVYVQALVDLFSGSDPPFVTWVPRAPERFQASGEFLQSAGFDIAWRSHLFDKGLNPHSEPGSARILVGDSLGEMTFYLAAADAVIVGGGFGPRGAHNVIEPLALGKPVITGPSVGTIEFPAVEAEAAGMLTVCHAPEDLPDAVRAAIGQTSPEKAEAFHASHRGASQRIYDAIRPLLSERR